MNPQLNVSATRVASLSAYYGLLVIVIVAIQLLGLWVYGVDRLDRPFVFRGDALHHLAVARAIVDQGWWWNITRLGAPFELDMYLFPVGAVIDYAFFWLLSCFSHDPVVVVNSFWVASFALTGVSACWSLRRLGIPPLVAFGGSIFYAFLPGAFYRSTSHLMLVYYSVPPAMAMCMLLLRGEWSLLRRNDRLIFWGTLALLGLSYIYYPFFSCLAFSLVAALLLCQGSSRRRDAIVGAVAIGVIAFFAALQLTPALIGWKADRIAKENIQVKGLADADTYGLKIRHLLIPRSDNPVPILRRVSPRLSKAGFPLENENGSARLGFMGAAGFLILIGLGLLRLVEQRPISGLTAVLGPAATLNLWLLLIATIGGLGSLFNLFVSPDIRAYNRVSFLIGFLALYAVCELLVRVKVKLADRGHNLWFVLGCGLAVALGVVDVAMFNYVASQWKVDRGLYESTRDFISQMEKQLPPGAMIFQLPDPPYPHTPKVFDMESHQHLGSYVVSHSARFSWPALSGNGLVFHRGLSMIGDPGALAEALSIVGFEGMLLDRWGLDERGVASIRRLKDFGAETVLESSEGRFLYLSLKKVKQRLAASRNPHDLAKARDDLLFPVISSPTGPLPETGFHARIDIEDAPLQAYPGEIYYIRVRVKNESTSIWHVGGVGLNTIRLSYGWVNPESGGPFGTRFMLPRDVNPGEAVDISLPVAAPFAPGSHSLEVDLVQEGVAWFSNKGSFRAHRNVVVNLLHPNPSEGAKTVVDRNR